MKTLEATLWTIGLLLLALFLSAEAWSSYASRRDLARFAEQAAQQAALPLQAEAEPLAPPVEGETEPEDSPLAPPSARTTRSTSGDMPIAVLRIPRIDLQVPVGFGTSEQVLLRGAGLVEGTAPPGSAGNVAIAAHRDSHFRGLKDVAIGELIELDTPQGAHYYRITELSVVEPTAVEVLADVGEPVLTLVTCYPFYFVGHAPKRFIVRAVAAEAPVARPTGVSP